MTPSSRSWPVPASGLRLGPETVRVVSTTAGSQVVGSTSLRLSRAIRCGLQWRG